MEKLLEQYLSGAAAWGCVSYDALSHAMGARARSAAERLVPSPRAVVAAAFPYFAGERPGNLSLYARGEDYHRVLARLLGDACAALRASYPAHSFVPLADASPLPEAVAAELAGLGRRGRNGLLYTPRYGSYVFLGTILTDYPCPGRLVPGSPGGCADCRACVRACPGGAIDPHGDPPAVDAGRCLSALTQRRGALSPAEREALRRLPTIWGCDICQTVCPMNRTAEISPIGDLTGKGETPYLSSLTGEMLDGLDEAGFQARFGDRAFAWRGLDVLRRNLNQRETGE